MEISEKRLKKEHSSFLEVQGQNYSKSEESVEYIERVESTQTGSPLIAKQKDWRRRYWILIAFGAALSFGFQNFIYSIVFEKENASGDLSIVLFYPSFMGMFILHIIYHIQEAVKLKMRKGQLWSKESSYYLKKKVVTSSQSE